MIVPTRAHYLRYLKQQLPPHSTIIEIGVHEGIFTAQLLTVFQPQTLILVDPWETNTDPNLNQGYYDYLDENGNPHPTAYSTQQQYQQILAQYQNNPHVQINRKYSFQAVYDYPNYYFDLIYIDACHLYPAVQQDLRDWYPKLKPGGILAGHDYIDVPWLGVYKALNEFCQTHDQRIIIQSEPHGPEGGGDWALKPTPNSLSEQVGIISVGFHATDLY